MNELSEITKPVFDLSALNLPNLTNPIAGDKHFARQSGEKFIVFDLGGKLFAVSSEQVAEVIHPPTVTPLPNVPEWLFGIANLRGEIISVVDLRQILTKENSVIAPKSKCVIARSSGSNTSIAFTVDKLSELITLSKEEIRNAGKDKSPYIFGEAAYRSNTLQLIDLEKISAFLEFGATAVQP